MWGYDVVYIYWLPATSLIKCGDYNEGVNEGKFAAA